MANKVASSFRRMPGMVVRRVSNAVNISGVSNDKRMFTRVRTHPDHGVTASFRYSHSLIAEAGQSQEYFTDIKDPWFAQADGN